MDKKNISIAIDGPVGSGKGTLAIALAKKLNAFYVYTGAMYRELALACFREDVDFANEDQILEVLGRVSIELKQIGSGIKAILNGEDVSEEIFQPTVSKLVPVVAAFFRVRKEMVRRQKRMMEETINSKKSIVMEGRDITTHVIPNADIKIYLTADVGKRAERRFKQFSDKGVNVNFDDVLKDLKERDRHDMQREASPLRIAHDAIVIDTTNDTVDQTVKKAIGKLKERNLI